MNNIRNQGGFTLIELVIVIVLLGILAAVAIPRFIDLETQANEASVDGVAGALASGMAINYSGCSAVDHDNSNEACTTVDDCDDGGGLLAGGLDADYNIQATALTSNGTTGTCTVELVADTAINADFQGIGAGQ